MFKSSTPKRPLSRRARQRLLPVAALEVTASIIVLNDLRRASSVRHGNKLLWTLLAFVQPIGPWLYFWFGQTRAIVFFGLFL